MLSSVSSSFTANNDNEILSEQENNSSSDENQSAMTNVSHLTFLLNQAWKSVNVDRLNNFQLNPNNDVVGVNPDLFETMAGSSPYDFLV